MPMTSPAKATFDLGDVSALCVPVGVAATSHACNLGMIWGREGVHLDTVEIYLHYLEGLYVRNLGLQ